MAFMANGLYKELDMLGRWLSGTNKSTLMKMLWQYGQVPHLSRFKNCTQAQI